MSTEEPTLPYRMQYFELDEETIPEIRTILVSTFQTQVSLVLRL